MTHKQKVFSKYIKDLHTQDECIGFIDGYEAAQREERKSTVLDLIILALLASALCIISGYAGYQDAKQKFTTKPAETAK